MELLIEIKGKIKPLLRVFNCCFVEKQQLQLRNLLSPDSHESCGLLFGRRSRCTVALNGQAGKNWTEIMNLLADWRADDG